MQPMQAFCLSKMISKRQRLHSKSPVSAHSIQSSLAPPIPWAFPLPTYQTPLHATTSSTASSHHSPHKTMSYSSASTGNTFPTPQTSLHPFTPHLHYFTKKYRRLRSGLHEVSTQAPPPFQKYLPAPILISKQSCPSTHTTMAMSTKLPF